jgi:hypothetical protein
VHILTEQKAQALASWLNQAKGRRVAERMHQDDAAMFAVCCQPWSQGQAGAHQSPEVSATATVWAGQLMVSLQEGRSIPTILRLFHLTSATLLFAADFSKLIFHWQ